MRECVGEPGHRVASLAHGVGNDEHAPTDMRGATIASRSFKSGTMEAKPCQIVLNLTPPFRVAGRLLDGNPLRTCDGNNSCHLGPEGFARAVPADGGGNAGSLTGWSAAYDISGNSICRQTIRGDGSDAFVAGDRRPVLRQDGAAERVNLAERDSSHSGTLKPEAETADAAEQVEDSQAIGQAFFPAAKQPSTTHARIAALNAAHSASTRAGSPHVSLAQRCPPASTRHAETPMILSWIV